MKCPCCEEKLIENQGIYHCSNCGYKDEYEDIPSNKYQKQRKFIEKITKYLLPKQEIKIRIVKQLEPGTYGLTRFKNSIKEPWKDSGRYILLPEELFKKSKLNPNPAERFLKTLTHELAHASDKVRLNPDFDPYSTEFKQGCKTCNHPHPGPGHDKI